MGQFLRELTPRQFIAWRAYEEIEPFGELRADYHAAQVVTMLHNIAVGKDGQKAIETFLLKFGETKKRRKQTVQEQIAVAKLIVMAHNAPGKNI